MKIVVFYYSQSGQAYNVAKNLFKTLNAIIVFKEIVPLHDYPFPWDKETFFDIFPETRLGLPPSGISPIDFSDIKDVDIVTIVGQSWFLSPSLPLQSFFSDEEVRLFLYGRKVVFVNACRNMWLMTFRRIKDILNENHSELIGHIVLQDHSPNLISAFTIVQWLLHGKKRVAPCLPYAGISEKDIKVVYKFGETIVNFYKTRKIKDLQEEIENKGGIKYKPYIIFLEKIGFRVFGVWARFIRKKGEMGDSHRIFRVKLFYAYLIIALFFVSPVVQFFFYLTYPFHNVKANWKVDCAIK